MYDKGGYGNELISFRGWFSTITAMHADDKVDGNTRRKDHDTFPTMQYRETVGVVGYHSRIVDHTKWLDLASHRSG